MSRKRQTPCRSARRSPLRRIFPRMVCYAGRNDTWRSRAVCESESAHLDFQTTCWCDGYSYTVEFSDSDDYEEGWRCDCGGLYDCVSTVRREGRRGCTETDNHKAGNLPAKHPYPHSRKPSSRTKQASLKGLSTCSLLSPPSQKSAKHSVNTPRSPKSASRAAHALENY